MFLSVEEKKLREEILNDDDKFITVYRASRAGMGSGNIFWSLRTVNERLYLIMKKV